MGQAACQTYPKPHPTTNAGPTGPPAPHPVRKQAQQLSRKDSSEEVKRSLQCLGFDAVGLHHRMCLHVKPLLACTLGRPHLVRRWSSSRQRRCHSGRCRSWGCSRVQEGSGGQYQAAGRWPAASHSHMPTPPGRQALLACRPGISRPSRRAPNTQAVACSPWDVAGKS